MRKKLFHNAFVLLCVVGVLDIIATKLYLFWTTRYFDSVIHFFGGMCVGYACLWLFLKDDSFLSSKKIFLISFFGALGVGVLWEIFELSFAITSLSDGMQYVTDTVFDLVMDVTGAVLVWLNTRRLFRESQI